MTGDATSALSSDCFRVRFRFHSSTAQNRPGAMKIITRKLTTRSSSNDQADWKGVGPWIDKLSARTNQGPENLGRLNAVVGDGRPQGRNGRTSCGRSSPTTAPVPDGQTARWVTRPIRFGPFRCRRRSSREVAKEENARKIHDRKIGDWEMGLADLAAWLRPSQIFLSLIFLSSFRRPCATTQREGMRRNRACPSRRLGKR